MGVLRSVARRRAESRFWGVLIIAVHRAFVLGLGAQHRGIVELSQSVFRCVTVFACYSSFFFLQQESSGTIWQRSVSKMADFRSDQVIRENPASRGTETSDFRSKYLLVSEEGRK